MQSVGVGGWWLTDADTDVQSVGTHGWWLIADLVDDAGEGTLTYVLRAGIDPTWTDREADADLIQGAIPYSDAAALPSQRMGEPYTDNSNRSNPSTIWTDR